MGATQERLFPEGTAELKLPDLLDPDELLPGSAAYTGFRFGEVQGEVFGDPYYKQKGLEIIIHGQQHELYVPTETVWSYLDQEIEVGEEWLQRLILDVINGKVGEIL